MLLTDTLGVLVVTAGANITSGNVMNTTQASTGVSVISSKDLSSTF